MSKLLSGEPGKTARSSVHGSPSRVGSMENFLDSTFEANKEDSSSVTKTIRNIKSRDPSAYSELRMSPPKIQKTVHQRQISDYHADRQKLIRRLNYETEQLVKTARDPKLLKETAKLDCFKNKPPEKPEAIRPKTLSKSNMCIIQTRDRGFTIQPKYFEYSGSMCVSELWPLQDVRRVVHQNEGLVINAEKLPIMDENRVFMSVYRPEKMEREYRQKQMLLNKQENVAARVFGAPEGLLDPIEPTFDPLQGRKSESSRRLTISPIQSRRMSVEDFLQRSVMEPVFVDKEGHAIDTLRTNRSLYVSPSVSPQKSQRTSAVPVDSARTYNSANVSPSNSPMKIPADRSVFLTQGQDTERELVGSIENSPMKMEHSPSLPRLNLAKIEPNMVIKFRDVDFSQKHPFDKRNRARSDVLMAVYNSIEKLNLIQSQCELEVMKNQMLKDEMKDEHERIEKKMEKLSRKVNQNSLL